MVDGEVAVCLLCWVYENSRSEYALEKKEMSEMEMMRGRE